MKKNILIQNIKQLSPKKWRLFLDFIDSPYFNKHQRTVVLGKYLFRIHSNWTEKNQNRHVIFSVCFTGQGFNLQKLKDLFSKLQKLLREFLAVQYLQEKEDWHKTALIQNAFQLNMTTLWQQQNKQFKQFFASSFYRFELSELEKKHFLKIGERNETLNVIDRQVEQLDFFYWKNKLRLLIEKASLSKVILSEIKRQSWKALESIPQHLLKNEAIKRYHIALSMLQADYPQSEPIFMALLESIKENNFQDSNEEETYAFYVYALNYCTARINSGHSDYYQHLFVVYELLDLHVRLIQNNHLSQWSFLNIVATACNLKKFDWAAHFIQTYHAYLPADQQKNALTYNFALLNFYKKDFDEAANYLHRLEFTDPYYSLNARVLELRIFYEKEEWIILDALFERFRIYLLRNKGLPKQRKLESQHFIKLTKNLSHLRQEMCSKKDKRQAVIHIQTKVKENKWLMHRAWLLEMCDRISDVQ